MYVVLETNNWGQGNPNVSINTVRGDVLFKNEHKGFELQLRLLE